MDYLTYIQYLIYHSTLYALYLFSDNFVVLTVKASLLWYRVLHFVVQTFWLFIFTDSILSIRLLAPKTTTGTKKFINDG